MNQKQYNNEIKKIAKLMSLESRINIVGSAKIKKSIYYSDYDSFSTVKGKDENTVYNHFRSVFEIIKSSDNTIITDFKVGQLKGNPLRWSYEDIKKRENKGVSFEDALKQKGMIKMDVVTLLNGRFIEITEVYNIFLNGKSNGDYSKETMINELKDDLESQVKDKNYMKALKRLYSLYALQMKFLPLRNKLLEYFNSPIGLLNRCKSDLETMLTVIDSKKFDIHEIRNSLQMLKEQISAFAVENTLEEISKLKSKDEMKVPIHKQVLRLKEYINNDAFKILRQIL